jgi:hypothetical protein
MYPSPGEDIDLDTFNPPVMVEIWYSSPTTITAFDQIRSSQKEDAAMNKRPAGVTVIVILLFLVGGLSLLWSLLVFGIGGLSSFFGGLIGADQVSAFGSSTAWSGFLGLVTGVFQIVVGFGLLAMKRWAWWLAMIGVGLNVVQALLSIFTGGIWGVMCGSISVIIPLIVLAYLLTPGIRRAFKI